MILPPLASDTAGACSMLFESGGLTVIHDAAGSMEVFCTFEEQRSLEHCRTVVSSLNQLEAATGNEQVLREKIVTELAQQPAPFAAIVGSPVPFTICIDLDGIAAEAEERSGTPVFAVTAGGFGLYHQGAGEALKKLLQRLSQPPRPQKGTLVNLLGAFPMDQSSAELEGMRRALLEAGADAVHSLTMNGSLDEVRHAADAALNIVIGTAGLPAAKWLKQKYKLPYVTGIPFDAESARLLLDGKTPAVMPVSGPRVLVLGESVFALSLARLCQTRFGMRAEAGCVTGALPGLAPEVARVKPETEPALRAVLAGEYDVIVGDPLYRLLLPAQSRAVFVERPHQALSSRLNPPVQEPLTLLAARLEQLACQLQGK